MDANSSASDACFCTLWCRTLRPVDVGSQSVLCRSSVVSLSFLCSVLTSEVVSSSSQLLLQSATLWGLHSFFCRVLPSEVFTASSAECYPLRSSQLLLQSATLWGLHSFFCRVLPSEVFTASSAECYPLRSSQLLLQSATLWGLHSFFCSVLPSEVFTASSAECYPLRSSQLLLQSATLWGLHSFLCSVLTSEVLTASSAVCYSLLSSQLFQQCAALWPCSEVRRGHSYRMCCSVWSATVTQSIWDVPWVCSVQFWSKRGMSALHSQGGRWGPRKVGSIQFWLWRLLSHTFLQLTINGQKYVYLSVIRSVFIFL